MKGTVMALHCSGWILCVFCANAARETIFFNSPINLTTKKYSDKIAEHYHEISPDFIQACAEKVLSSLVEVEGGSSAEEVVRGYLY
jgi:benzoyl-CoA reductase/2-hydroxyglutaryl-CoA dehydratase subunit BcrC/BadD/HgdB